MAEEKRKYEKNKNEKNKKTKRENGKYRVRKMIDGKSYSMTFDHKPTQKEIDIRLDEMRHTSVTYSNAPKKTFEECASKYFDVKENIQSASTIRTDESRVRNLSEEFRNTLLCDIDNLLIQTELNRLSATRASKTVDNYYTIIKNVIKLYIPKFAFEATIIDRGSKLEKYIPKPEEAKKILDASNDKYWIMFMLAAYGLRRSETTALIYPDDFDEENNIISINKAYVFTRNKEWVVQPFNKTKKSTRYVPVVKELIDRIREQGYVYEGHPSKILEYLHTKQKQLGIHDFRLHDFRGYFATEMDQAGIASKDAQYVGGWSSAAIMEKSYKQDRVHDSNEIQEKIARTIGDKLI